VSGGELQLWQPGALDGLALAGAVSSHTRRAYRGDLEAFGRWAVERGAGQLDELLCAAWRDELIGRGYKASTVNRRLVALRIACAELVRRGELAYNPAEHVRGVRPGNEPVRRALSLLEARSLIGACVRDITPRGRRDEALLAVALRTGLRAAELRGVTWGDVRQEGAFWLLSYRAKGHAGESWTKLAPDLIERLNVWRSVAEVLAGPQVLDRDQPVWRGLDGPTGGGLEIGAGVVSPSGWRLRPAGLSAYGLVYIVRARGRQAGLGDLSPHVLRRTFVSLALAAGAPLRLVQYAAGHADPRTTERYDAGRRALDHHATDYVQGI
jgi:site-specific recombinase XerD